jgi:hypothetical protein
VNVKSSSGSPFKASKNNTVQDILDRIKKFMPQDMVGHPLKTEIFSSSSILHIGGSYSKWPTTLPLTLCQI